MMTRFVLTVRHGAVTGLALVLVAGCKKKDRASEADSTMAAAPVRTVPGIAAAAGTTFDCGSASGDVEKLVCGDTALSALNRRLADTYMEAATKQGAPVPAWLTGDQRDWVTQRDGCAARPNLRACVDSSYTLRIAEIQATAMLVPTKGPVTYVCTRPGGGHDELTAMFAETNPASVVLERGDRSFTAYTARSGNGARYEGAKVSFRDRAGQAQVTWMGTALNCHEQAGSS